MHKLPIPYNLRKFATKAKMSKESHGNISAPLTPSCSTIQKDLTSAEPSNAITSSAALTNDTDHHLLPPPTEPLIPVSASSPSTQTQPLASLPQISVSSPAVIENQLGSSLLQENAVSLPSHYETPGLSATMSSPIFPVHQQHPTSSITTSSNSGQDVTGIETWAQGLLSQNLVSPPNHSQANDIAVCPLNQRTTRDWAQPQYPMLNPQTTSFIPSPNVSLPPFWEHNVELWFATAEHAFSASGVFNEHKRFSLVLSALDLKIIQKIQNVIRSPTSFPYQAIKKALINACKLNENDRLDMLFNHTELGDRKPSEMLNHMRLLLEAYDANNAQTNAVLRKLFLDKLPAQARTILAASLESNLDSLALRADEVVAALSQTSNPTGSTSHQQQLINEIFDTKLNKIIDALQQKSATNDQPAPRQNRYRPNFNSSSPNFQSYRPNFYNNQHSYRPFHSHRTNYGSRESYRPRYNAYNQEQSYFQQPKNAQIRHRGSAASNQQ